MVNLLGFIADGSFGCVCVFWFSVCMEQTKGEKQGRNRFGYRWALEVGYWILFTSPEHRVGNVLLVRFCTALTVLSAAFTFQIFFLIVIDTSTDRLRAILGSIKEFLLFFRCSFAGNALSVISLFRRILNSFMFTSCSALCRYADMHKSFSIKWATMQEHKCITQVDTRHSLQETLMEFFGFSVNTESSKLMAMKKANRDRLLIAGVCQKPSPSVTVHDSITEAWGETCFQSLEEMLSADPGWGKKYLKESLLATSNVINSILFLGRLQDLPDFKWVLWDTDINFLDDCLKNRRTEGPVFPELPSAKSFRWVSVALGTAQDIAGGGQV